MPSKHLSIVQLVPALNAGGVERGTLEVADELVKQGHRSIVISAGGRLVDRLIASGSEHLQIDIGKKSLLSLRHIAFLRQYFREENIDIVHPRSRFPAWLTYLAWRKMDKSSRPRFITTVHGAYSVNPYSKVMTKGQDIIAVSEFILDYIKNNYPSADETRITLIHRGVSKTEFPFNFQPHDHWLKTWLEKYPAISNKFILTMPARVTRLKGHEDFLEILNRLKQQNIPIHGLIAGGVHHRKTRYLNQLKEIAHSHGLENDITFLGHRSDIKEIMSISNIVLSLAKTPEAFGRTALEALCLGVPVIAYNHGGAAEILAKMYPEGLVEPDNTIAVSDKVISFYKQSIPVSDKNLFTLDKMLDKTLSLYSRVLSQISIPGDFS